MSSILGRTLARWRHRWRCCFPGQRWLYTFLFGAVSVLLEVFVSYGRYARVLKWATLSLFSYVAVVFVVDVPWGEAIRNTLVPQFTFDKPHAMALVAIFGTTISPYLFFWQAGQEVEEQHRRHIKPLCVSPRTAGVELERIRTDTLVGMGFSHIVALFIVIATAATLHANGITEIESAAQAAEALRPIAGDLAFALFAIGIIGTGMLAVPILAGSAAYAVSEAFGWTEGLDRKPREAKAFYGVIAAGDAGRGRAQLHRHRSDEGALLGSRGQWPAGPAADGGDHADRQQSGGDGRHADLAGAENWRLALDAVMIAVAAVFLLVVISYVPTGSAAGGTACRAR